MKKIFAVIPLLLCLFLFSCQKEVDFANGNGGGNGGGTGGTSNGDLLVKALQVTTSTNDTNVITFQWDANKRLLAYNTNGKVNGVSLTLSLVITRESDGKIKKIVDNNSLYVIIDSIVHYVHYKTGTTKLDYVISINYSTLLGDLKDSSSFTYNTSGKVFSKETFAEDLLGGITKSKSEYTYDAGGNLITLKGYDENGSGGYDLSLTVNYTYSSHKSAVVLGDESYIAMDAENASKSDLIKEVNDNYTAIFSQQQYNSFDRPAQAHLNAAAQPPFPGFDMKVIYYYQ
jgi:hypothetical protein